jgi:hypothetical protein
MFRIAFKRIHKEKIVARGILYTSAKLFLE